MAASAGLIFFNFVSDGETPEYTAFGDIYLKFGDDTKDNFGGGQVAVHFKDANGVFHPLVDLTYQTIAETLKSFPAGVKIAFKLVMSGATDPDLNCHIFVGTLRTG